MKTTSLLGVLGFLLTTGAGSAWCAPVEGVITAVDAERRQVVLSIGGAEARDVTASVGRGDARILAAGDAVRGDLVSYGDGFRLQTIWPNDPVARGTITRIGDQLRRDTLTRGSRVFRGVGEFMPRFALYDSDGSLFLSESLKGRYAVMNFIFTRCTVATMCPAATERMGQLQRLARERGIDDLELVSVTLDPAYDTPGIFTAYAADKGIDTANFHFLGGPEGIVEDLKKQMGVLAEPDEEEIVRHTMSTALIDPNGKIIYRIPGSMWSPQAFLDKLEADRSEKSDPSD
jgi:protein SCO1/2